MVTCNHETPGDKARRLVREKYKIEQEIAELNAVLNTNNVGMREPLVDDEGFPRNDIDVARVRHARHRIICLQNDHKDKMKEIEASLAELHAEARANGAGPSNVQMPHANGHAPNGHMANGHVPNGHLPNGHVPNGHAENAAAGVAPQPQVQNEVLNVNQTPPFALVDSVCFGSPAHMAGMRSEDAIIQFGSLNFMNMVEPNLNQMNDLIDHSVGQRIRVKVKRGDNVLNLVVVPRPWQPIPGQNRRSLFGANLRRIMNC